MDYEELERRILKKLEVDTDNLPDKIGFLPKEEYKLVYCIVQALVEYDKMRNEKD